MVRGIEQKEIFINDADHSDFIERLAARCDEGPMGIYAWILKPNLFHLLCKTRKRPLSSSMREIFFYRPFELIRNGYDNKPIFFCLSELEQIKRNGPLRDSAVTPMKYEMIANFTRIRR